jgi:hypothetical protein
MSGDSAGLGRACPARASPDAPAGTPTRVRAAARQVISGELWQATAPGGTLSSEPGPGPLTLGPAQRTPLAKGS